MLISQAFDAIPEMMHLDEAKFIQDSKAILATANQASAMRKFGEETGLGGFWGGPIVRGTRQERDDLVALPPERRIRVEVRIVRRPMQRLAKHVRVAWWHDEQSECYAHDFYFPIQFLGYGGYSLAHFNNGTPEGKAAVDKFFATLSANHVNLHRTFIFTNGRYEFQDQNTVCLLDIPGSGPQAATVSKAFTDNLTRLANAARSRGVVLQICLFPRQSVEVRADLNMIPDGLGNAFKGNAQENIKQFFKVGGPWEGLQRNVVDAVTKACMSNWNVVFEIANELDFAPGVNDIAGQAQLREWLNATADYVRRKTYGKLQTSSCSRRVQAPHFSLSTLDFASFHRGDANLGGQWLAASDMDAARGTVAGYGDKHLVFDDDGKREGRDLLGNIEEWARTALTVGGVGPCSYVHKGHYDPRAGGCFNAADIGQLGAMKRAWESVFQPIRPGVNISVPRPEFDRVV